MPKLLLDHSSPEHIMACRQIKKEHLNQVAHCLSKYLERLLHSTDYENNLNLQYHNKLCINVSCINRCSMKFFNSIVCRKVCKLTDPLHYHNRLSKKLDRACQLQLLVVTCTCTCIDLTVILVQVHVLIQPSFV